MTKKWKRWFKNLKAGDKAIIQLPWDDRNHPGGRKCVATVSFVSNSQIKQFNYRITNRRFHFTTGQWQGDCYHHVCPVGHSIEYCPKRGLQIIKVGET